MRSVVGARQQVVNVHRRAALAVFLIALAGCGATRLACVPEGDHGPGIQVDDQGRLQLYPALKRLGNTRMAVIQSTHDNYVPSAESRKLLGPDTQRLRLYEVDARDHGFSDARDKLLQDLDDALGWIQEAPPAPWSATSSAQGTG